MTTPMRPVQLRYASAFQAEDVASADNLDFGGVLTTDDLARDGNVWVSDGMDVTRFLASRTINFNHDPELPVAQITSLTKESGRIRFKARFSTPGASAVADMVRAQVKDGTLNSLSASIIPLEMEPLKGAGGRQVGWKITKSDLIDFAIVSAPANAGCLITERSADRIMETNDMPEQITADDNQGVSRAMPRLTLKRDLYDVSWLAYLLMELAWLQSCVESEANQEDDGSMLPAQLTEALKLLGQTLVSMANEEVAELLADHGVEEEVEQDESQGAVERMANGLKRAVIGMVRCAAGATAAKIGARAIGQMDSASIAVALRVNLLSGAGRAALADLIESRAGRVLSSDNEATLRDAHEHLCRAVDGVKGVLDQVDDDAAPDEAPAASDERALRRRKAKALKLKVSE